MQAKIDVLNVVTPSMLKDSNAQQRDISARLVTIMDTSQACASRTSHFQAKSTKSNQLQTEEIYLQDDSICRQTEELTSSDDSFCLQIQIQCAQAKPKLPITSHVITNLAYKCQPHHKWNHYLRAWMDTSADVNIMPASVYKLLFKDPH